MLHLHHVQRSFGALRAVAGVSFDVGAGEVLGLLGPNGAGKSTTINMIAGLLQPDAGEIRIADLGSPMDRRVRMRIGLAPQRLAVYEELTAEQNLRFFGSLFGLRGGDLRDRAAQQLKFTQLTDRAGSRVKTFSGGMKRRLNLGCALVHNPKLVLLDEPTAGVDPQSRNAIYDMVESLRDLGAAILYSTHYMEEAQRLCSRVAIMDHGKILAIDSVPKLIDAHGGKPIANVVRVDGAKERIEVTDFAQDMTTMLAGAAIAEVRINQPSLESVFLSLTGKELRD